MELKVNIQYDKVTKNNRLYSKETMLETLKKKKEFCITHHKDDIIEDIIKNSNRR